MHSNKEPATKRVTANRHLETYAPDTEEGMSLIHFLFHILDSFCYWTLEQGHYVSATH